jgi:hypothetical protein
VTRKLFFTICSVALLLSFTTNTFANLILTEGGPTGQWWNPAREGEGFFVEIIDGGNTNQIGVAMYSFDADGDPL